MATRSAKSAQTAGRAKKSLYRPENEAVWASFRQMRKAAKLSQGEFGQRLGRNQSYVSAAETGVIRLDALQIRSWCEVAGTDMRTWIAVLEAQLAAVTAVQDGQPPK
jgi:transcriptional regulator with XRE-family HTH domain